MSHEVDNLKDTLEALAVPARAFELRVIKICRQALRKDDCQRLSEALQSAGEAVKDLQELNLSYNIVGVGGVKHLVNALSHLKWLRTLNLGSNLIGRCGIEHLTSALPHLPSLQTLLINDMELEQVDVRALAYELEVCSSVTQVKFDGWRVESKFVPERKVLSKLLARNRRFRNVYLFDARQLLLSKLSPDAVGVLWPYFAGKHDSDNGKVEPANAETLRAEYADIAEERVRCAGMHDRDTTTVTIKARDKDVETDNEDAVTSEQQSESVDTANAGLSDREPDDDADDAKDDDTESKMTPAMEARGKAFDRLNEESATPEQQREFPAAANAQEAWAHETTAAATAATAESFRVVYARKFVEGIEKMATKEYNNLKASINTLARQEYVHGFFGAVLVLMQQLLLAGKINVESLKRSHYVLAFEQATGAFP
jgi:hypothetical protein